MQCKKCYRATIIEIQVCVGWKKSWINERMILLAVFKYILGLYFPKISDSGIMQGTKISGHRSSCWKRPLVVRTLLKLLPYSVSSVLHFQPLLDAIQIRFVHSIINVG